MTVKTVQFNYTPRPQFVDFHQRSERFAAMVCHRRAGKTVACVNELVLRALYSQKKNARYGYVAPFRAQAREIAWTYLKEATDSIRIKPPRESDLRVILPNDAWITLYGADNPDALRGVYFDGLILDEYGDMRPSLMGEVILPTLADRKGWMVIIGTPKGRNQFYETHLRAQESPEWYSQVLRASESGILDPEELDLMKAQMDPARYAQEMECSFDAAVKGTYYTDIMNDLQEKGQILSGPEAGRLLDPVAPVHVVCDLGYSDSCAFWFWQERPDGYAIVDYYENQSKNLKHYLEMLAEKRYNYGDVWLPHDARAATLQTGRSTVEQFENPYFLCPERYTPDFRFNLKLVPRLSVQDGIDAARLILPSCWFDQTTTHRGIECLRAHKRKYNEMSKSYADKPEKDWTSDGADAFRYFALVAGDPKPGVSSVTPHDSAYKPHAKPATMESLTLNALFAEQERYEPPFIQGRI